MVSYSLTSLLCPIPNNCLSRLLHPEIWEYFPQRPTHILVCVIECIWSNRDSTEVYMADHIEDFSASGLNFGHSGGSIPQTNLEVLRWVMEKWPKAVEACKHQYPGGVSIVYVCVCVVLCTNFFAVY